MTPQEPPMSYDQRQISAPLLLCAGCGIARYVTRPTTPWYCVDCREKLPATAEPPRG
jgi:hypothetical protein